MTEAEWLAAADVRWLGLGRGMKISPRKQRLCAAAFCRRIEHLLTNVATRQAIEVAERYADRRASRDELRTAHAHASADFCSTETFRTMGEDAMRLAAVAVCWATHPDKRHYVVTVADSASAAVTHAAFDPALRSPLRHATEADYESHRALWATTHARECSTQVGILRDIVGNPFRPVSLARSVCPPGVKGLAGTAYAERQLPSGHLDAARLAVLADALEEAGCADAEILSHLRSPGPHVRGCWAVDLACGRD